jgi:hypothetical protein
MMVRCAEHTLLLQPHGLRVVRLLVVVAEEV